MGERQTPEGPPPAPIVKWLHGDGSITGVVEVQMKRLGGILLAVLSIVVAQPAAQPPAGPDIRLVLLIAVDQFRYDYLTRFRGEYSSGIKRLLDDGAVFTNANLEHYPTVTAVGHATMLSGATPSVSGIIGNDWFDRETGAIVTSVFDPSVTPVGSPPGPAASPRRLLVSTLGDELKMGSGRPTGAPDRPRVIGVSLKDRAAILAVGRGAGHPLLRVRPHRRQSSRREPARTVGVAAIPGRWSSPRCLGGRGYWHGWGPERPFRGAKPSRRGDA